MIYYNFLHYEDFIVLKLTIHKKNDKYLSRHNYDRDHYLIILKNVGNENICDKILDLNLRLSKKKICDKIINLNFPIIDNKTLILRLSEAFKFSINIINNYIDNKDNLNGLEKNDFFGKTNSLIWEFGHVFFFYEQMTKKLLTNDNQENINIDFDPEIYDSFLVDRDSRFNILKEILNKKKR